MSIADNSKRLRLAPNGVLGYLHNPLEISQGIDVMRGIRKHPEHMALLMNVFYPSVEGQPDLFALRYTDIECMVIEICSIRIIECNGWYLQLNRFRDEVQRYGLTEQDMNRVFSNPDEKAPLLSKLRKRSDATDFANIFEACRFFQMQENEVYEAVLHLRKQIDHPVVFVGVVTHDYENRPIEQRVIADTVLKRIEKDVPHTLYVDPTLFVDRDGMSNVMRDLRHYTTEYEAVVAQELTERIVAFCESNSQARSYRERRLQRQEIGG